MGITPGALIEFRIPGAGLDPTFADVAQELDDVGEEFGCARDPAETNEEYGVRVMAYLDEMIEELRLTQEKVNELIS